MFQHMAREVEIREINLAIDYPQYVRGLQEPIIAAWMHLIKAVGQVMRTCNLQHNRLGPTHRIGDSPIAKRQFQPRIHCGHIRHGAPQHRRLAVRIGLRHEFAECLRAAQTQQKRLG